MLQVNQKVSLIDGRKIFWFFVFSSRRRHTRYWRDWSSDVCSSDLAARHGGHRGHARRVRRARRPGERGLPRPGRAVPPGGPECPAARAGPGGSELPVARRVQRPGRQRLGAPADHDPVAGTLTPGCTDRVRSGSTGTSTGEGHGRDQGQTQGLRRARGRAGHHQARCRSGRRRPHMSITAETAGATAIRPFHVDVREEALTDLRRRIAATQWPERETVPDQSQGVPLAVMQELARHWATDYDWRACEARLNALPQLDRKSTL